MLQRMSQEGDINASKNSSQKPSSNHGEKRNREETTDSQLSQEDLQDGGSDSSKLRPINAFSDERQIVLQILKSSTGRYFPPILRGNNPESSLFPEHRRSSDLKEIKIVTKNRGRGKGQSLEGAYKVNLSVLRPDID